MLLHDPMHLLFEGITGVELKSLLHYLIINEKLLQLSFLNQQLSELSNSLRADCRQNSIELQQLMGGDIKQTAHQMWYFSNLIPIAIGSIVKKNDAKRVNFIRLLQIQQLCTSPIATETTIESLTICIARHNNGYVVETGCL